MKTGNRFLSALPLAAVTLLLEFGAPMIAPGIARASHQSNDALLCESLRYLRTEIQVYSDQHQNSAPGYAAIDEQFSPEAELLASISDDIPIPPPTADADIFTRQLTLFTDTQGHVRPERGGSCKCGPYIIEIPKNPITLKAGVLVVDQADMPKVDESKPHGWIYNARTRQLIANAAGTDSAGVRYANY